MFALACSVHLSALWRVAERVYAALVFTEHKITRDIEFNEPPLQTITAYKQRSCFVVYNYRLARRYRAVDSSQPGLPRFGRVLYFVRESPDGPPVRAVVNLFHHLHPADIEAQCDGLPDRLGSQVWRPQRMVNVDQFTKLSLPVNFVTRSAVIAMHVQRLARDIGLAFCLSSLPKEY